MGPRTKKLQELIEIAGIAQLEYPDIDIKSTEEIMLLESSKYPGIAFGSGVKRYDHENFFNTILPKKVRKLCKEKKYVLALNLVTFCHNMKIFFGVYRKGYAGTVFVYDPSQHKADNLPGTLHIRASKMKIEEQGLVVSLHLLNITRNLLVEILSGLNEEPYLHEIFDLFDDDIVDLNLLETILKYHLKNSNINEAEKILNKLERLDPFLDIIKEADYAIKREKRIDQLMKKNINFNAINDLDGVSFERLLLKQFTESGFTARLTSTTGDFGADIIVTSQDGTVAAIQCKRFSQKVNLKAVQEVVASLPHYSADFGIVISNNKFLNSATKLAASNDVELWDGAKLLMFFNGERNFSQLFD